MRPAAELAHLAGIPRDKIPVFNNNNSPRVQAAAANPELARAAGEATGRRPRRRRGNRGGEGSSRWPRWNGGWRAEGGGTPTTPATPATSDGRKVRRLRLSEMCFVVGLLARCEHRDDQHQARPRSPKAAI